MTKQKKIVLSLLSSSVLINNIYAKEITKFDDIIVTAQKQEQNIQNVPISMSVFNEFDIEDKNIESLKDIEFYTPNLMLFNNGGGGSFSPTIRGLNTAEGSYSSSIGVFIDGIPILGTSGFDVTLMDIERIEVLKGPQGTLYGKGTQTGVINVITKKPNNETRINTTLDVGSDNKRVYSFNASGAVIKDKFYVGLSAKHYEKDGFIKNTNTGGFTDDREHNFGKLNLRFTPSENLDISLISSLLKYDNKGDIWGNQVKRETSSNQQYSKPQTLLNSLKIEYDLEKYKIESITTNKVHKNIWYKDFDYTSNTIVHTNFDDKMKNLSQEFRLKAQNDKFSWIVEVNADKDKKDLYHQTISSMPGYSSIVEQDIKEKSYGIFGHIDYKLKNNLNLIGGLRYDKNDITFTQKGINAEIENSYSEVSPKLALNYNLSKNNMLYTTISKGYRPGGFYPYAPSGYSKKYDKETLWSYEIGSKNKFLDNRLVLNSALYYMAIDNMQVTSVVNSVGNSYKSNAAEATSKGFELDINYKANNNLELFAAFGYNDTKFDEYKDLSGDYSGKINPYAPKYNYNLGFQYRSDLGLYLRTDINAQGKIYLDRQNLYKRDSFNLVNMKIGYERENFNVYLYSNNIANKKYDALGVYGFYNIYSPPRETGIKLTYRF